MPKLSKDLDESDYFEVAMVGDYKLDNESEMINVEKEMVIPLHPDRMKAKSRKEKLRKKLNKRNLKIQTHLKGLEKGLRKDIQQLRSIQFDITSQKKELLKRKLINIKKRQNIEKKKLLHK